MAAYDEVGGFLAPAQRAGKYVPMCPVCKNPVAAIFTQTVEPADGGLTYWVVEARCCMRTVVRVHVMHTWLVANIERNDAPTRVLQKLCAVQQAGAFLGTLEIGD